MTRAPSLSWRTLNCFEFWENGSLEVDDAMINLIMDSSVCAWVSSIVNDLGIPVSRKGLQRFHLLVYKELDQLSDSAVQIPDIFARLDCLDHLDNLTWANHELNGMLRTIDFSTKSKKWYLFVILSLLMIGGIEPNPGPGGRGGGNNRRRERQQQTSQEHNGRPETPATTEQRTAGTSQSGVSEPGVSRGGHRRGGRGRGPLPGPIPGSSGNRAMHEQMTHEIQQLQGQLDAERELRVEVEQRNQPVQPPPKPVTPVEDPVGRFSENFRRGFWFGEKIDYSLVMKMWLLRIKRVLPGAMVLTVVLRAASIFRAVSDLLRNIPSCYQLLKFFVSSSFPNLRNGLSLQLPVSLSPEVKFNFAVIIGLVKVGLGLLGVACVVTAVMTFYDVLYNTVRHGGGKRRVFMEHVRPIGDPAERTAADVLVDLRSEASRQKEIKYVPRLELWRATPYNKVKSDMLPTENDLVVSMTLAYFVYSSKAVNCDDPAKLFDRIQMAVHQYPMVHISAVCELYPTHSIYSDTARFVYGLCMSQRDRDSSLDFLH